MTPGESVPVFRTVVVCDDREELRQAIRLVLADVPQLRVIGEAFDGASCLAGVRELLPDVLILDVSMPGGGPELAKAARDLHPGMRIVVFSGHREARIKDAMLQAGVDLYVVKTGRLRPLLDALDQVFA